MQLAETFGLLGRSRSRVLASERHKFTVSTFLATQSSHKWWREAGTIEAIKTPVGEMCACSGPNFLPHHIRLPLADDHSHSQHCRAPPLEHLQFNRRINMYHESYYKPPC